MQLEVGTVIEGKVTGITKFGAFVEIPGGKTGMVHISEVAPTYVTEIRDHVTENQTVKVKVLSVGEDGKISLSIKKALEPRPQPRRNTEVRTDRGPSRPANIEWSSQRREPANFEDMLSRFKQSSDDKQAELKRSMKDGGRRGRRGENH